MWTEDKETLENCEWLNEGDNQCNALTPVTSSYQRRIKTKRTTAVIIERNDENQ